MNIALIMLGSNSNAKLNLEIAKVKLSLYFKLENQSSLLVTKPVGENYYTDFNNLALRIFTVLTLEETTSIFKSIEKELGRTNDSKKSGQIPIDIDLIAWNSNIIHKDYDRFDFVKKCIDEIK